MGGDNDEIIAYLPNTKRKCHSKIKLRLTGYGEDSGISSNIDLLTITNGSQIIEIKNVSKTSVIEISTEDHQILIDGEIRDDLVSGFFDKIEPTIKYDDYLIPYIDDTGQEQKKQIDLEYKLFTEIREKVNAEIVRIQKTASFHHQSDRRYGQRLRRLSGRHQSPVPAFRHL